MIKYKIKQLRQAKGLTLEYLSYKAKVGLSTISEIENNKHDAYFETVVRIADALQVEVNEVYE